MRSVSIEDLGAHLKANRYRLAIQNPDGTAKRTLLLSHDELREVRRVLALPLDTHQERE